MARHCTLLFDEMSLKEYVEYNSVNDYVHGFPFVIDSDNIVLANSVLVFLLCGISSTWKMPVSYFFFQEMAFLEEYFISYSTKF